MNRAYKFSFLILLIFTLTNSACYKNSTIETELPSFSSVDDVINPPDEFELVFNLRTFNDYEGIIVFESNAVWEIEKITALSSLFWVERVYPSYTDKIDFGQLGVVSYQIGFAGGITYHFWANSNGIEDAGNFFVRFKKMDVDYETFHPKL